MRLYVTPLKLACSRLTMPSPAIRAGMTKRPSAPDFTLSTGFMPPCPAWIKVTSTPAAGCPVDLFTTWPSIANIKSRIAPAVTSFAPS